MAVYSVSTASSPLFDISPPRSFVTSLTEINVTDEPLFLYGLFFLVLHSLSHHSQRLSPPPRASLRPRGVVFRSLSSARGPPTLTRERERRRGGGELTWRVTPTHHEPEPGLASLQHEALPWRPPHRAAVVTSHPTIWERRESSHGVRLRQSGVTFLIRPYHIAIITLTKQAKLTIKASVSD